MLTDDCISCPYILTATISDDQCRVWLFPLPKQPYSNYINASYIDGFRTRKAFIATQSPLTQTMADYWRMVGNISLLYFILVQAKSAFRYKTILFLHLVFVHVNTRKKKICFGVGETSFLATPSFEREKKTRNIKNGGGGGV